ncbi:putative nucleotidyltransferase substrate binding domain-containing protein [Paracoccus ravus]|uniref:putative nucleotidyltransferase substrate binding domain-containing protein n=1 Tax=Paracoccus ravus TaxID=2447760 RepID=UPI00106E78D3|nr:putative nucleotidyltransferase substrate binding domain-containing protein [Paracoccus ravus]
MDQISSFLATIHPYDALSQDELARVARFFSRREWQAGEIVYRHGEPLDGLYLIESAGVEVTGPGGEAVSSLGRGNSFGERGLLRDGLAATSARVSRSGTILLLPPVEFRHLMAANTSFARFFHRGVSRARSEAGAQFADLRVAELLSRPPVFCAPEQPIVAAARMMRDAGISSLGVTAPDGRLLGIVTVRDISGKVVAEGRDPQAPVATIMTSGPISLGPEALGADVLNLMAERGIGHLPITEAGRFVGMITQTDLARVQAVLGSVLMREIAGAPDDAALRRATARIPELLASLVAASQRQEVITRQITDVADAVTRRLLRMAEERLGPPPAAWLWAACGSQGRQEQTGVSDQDNCLILAPGADPDHPWFGEFARIVTDGLNAAGYVYCPGEMMASNPRWRQPIGIWRDYFRGWIQRPSPEAQMLASVMFDLRAIGGDVALLAELQAETLWAARRNSIFVAHMIANSLKHRPPLGLIGGFATIRSGEHRNQIDMKLNGVVPITDLARIYALQGGIPAVNTRARLVAAGEAGVMSPSGAADMIAAYDLIQSRRLEHQARRVRAGLKPDNFLAPVDLPDFERSHLRDAFVVVRSMQSAVGHGKGALG